MINTDKLAEALRRLVNTFPIPVDGVEQADRSSLRLALFAAREALAAHEAAARATAPETGDTNGRHDGLRPDLHGRVPLGGHTPGDLADLLWASDDVMALNAEMGLPMDRLVQFAQAVLAAEKAEPAGEAVPVAWRSKEIVNGEFETDWILTKEEPADGVHVVAKEALYTRPPAAPAAEPLTVPAEVAEAAAAFVRDGYRGPLHMAQTVFDWVHGIGASGGEVQHG